MSTETASPPTDDGRWEFLEDTYWYVPVPYLPAVVLVNVDPAQTTEIVDQTVWHITSVENGFVGIGGDEFRQRLDLLDAGRIDHSQWGGLLQLHADLRRRPDRRHRNHGP